MEDEVPKKSRSKWFVPVLVAFLASAPGVTASIFGYLKTSEESDSKVKFNYETFSQTVTALQEDVTQLNQKITAQNLIIANVQGRVEVVTQCGQAQRVVRAPEPRVELPVPIPAPPPPTNPRNKFAPLKKDFKSAYEDSQQVQMKK